MKINYRAKQVLVSEGAFDSARTIPMGTNLIGKTLTTIDTRDANQLVKVLLPYGGRFSGGGEIPKNSIVFGQVSYGGKGKKVFIKFSKGILPSGEEFPIEAQALSSGDYSPGVSGRFHGNADLRIASTLGLTMVAGMSDVLTEKESLGGSALQSGSVTPKATMKNAIMHGVSQVAQSEAQRQAEEIGNEQEYVTVDAGTDLIVSLLRAFVEQ
ncbi:MAG: TrbI/VirB10 family protein [Bacteriovoracia bacterium]